MKIQTELDREHNLNLQEGTSLSQARAWGGHPIAHSVPGYYGQRVTRYSSIVPYFAEDRKDLEISKSSILKKKKKKESEEQRLDQSELEPETPGSRNLGLSIWAIYNSTTRSGKRVLKYLA